jgi:RNA polymerase sigma factor (sigma-70 family)
MALDPHEARPMARSSMRTAYGYLHSLFVGGVTSSLTDGQLLERFAERQDEVAEAAFAVLVQRHGPAVLRVCRAILGDEHHAEDAFQATFLVLVKKGGSLWVRDSLGPWLHRVACRAAARLKQDANRRRAHERHFAESVARRAGTGEREDLAWVIHEEIDRLPERFRPAVVLCDVEGCSYEEAAQRLRWSVATVKGRLARGRERLRGRLTDRGLASCSPLLVLGLATEANPAVVPPVLVRSSIEAALCVAARGPVASGTVSAPVALLVKGVLTTMALTKLKTGVVLLSVICAAATATALVQAQQEGGGRRKRMGPDRRAATARMVPVEGATKPSGSIPSGLTFDEIRPTLEKLLKEKGSAKVTTLDGIEVSVRLYDMRELSRSRPLLEQVLLCGPVDIRGPADPEPADESGSQEQRKLANAKQAARQLLSSARRDIISGDLDKAAEKIAQARAMDVKWGLFDDTPDKAAAALGKVRIY